MVEVSVSDAMTSPVLTCAPELPISEAYLRLTEHAVSSLAVVDDDRLVGVLSRADLLPLALVPNAPGRLPGRPVRSVMSSPAITVDAHDALRDAARVMVEHAIHRVYVLRGDALAGVVSTRDVMDVVARTPSDVPISELATVPVHVVDVEVPVAEAARELDALGITALIVCEREQPVGVLSRRGALAARDLDPNTPVDEAMDAAVICLHETASVQRAARLTRRMGARRIVTTWHRALHGVLSGMDFARYLAEAGDA